MHLLTDKVFNHQAAWISGVFEAQNSEGRERIVEHQNVGRLDLLQSHSTKQLQQVDLVIWKGVWDGLAWCSFFNFDEVGFYFVQSNKISGVVLFSLKESYKILCAPDR